MDESTTKLVEALENKRDYRLKPMIERAKQGYYHDYKSPIATPCIQLVQDLQLWGHKDLVQRAINGEFEATLDESEAWVNSADGKEALSQLPPGMREMFIRKNV